MPIPNYERVIYKKPALDNVVCQLRFPPILKIGSEAPALFQDGVRDEFPLFDERIPELPPNLPAEFANIISAVGPQTRAYDFASADGKWKVSLTRDFLALSTEAYRRWESFRSLLEKPIARLHEVYQPAFYSRIGLRYRDVIIRSKLGLDEVPWSELLSRHVAAELAPDSEVCTDVIEARREILLSLGDGVGFVRIRHGHGQVDDSGEICYIIDADYHTDNQTETNDAHEVLDKLNSFAGRLFRWCIQDRLHEAMEPEPVDDR